MDKDSSDAHGLDNGEVLESSEDSTRVPTDALSGDQAREPEEHAGEEPHRSLRDSEEAEPCASLSESSIEP